MADESLGIRKPSASCCSWCWICFANVMAAGRLAVELGILPFDVAYADNAVLVCFRRWLMSMDGIMDDVTREALSVIGYAIRATKKDPHRQAIHGSVGAIRFHGRRKALCRNDPASETVDKQAEAGHEVTS